jgi:hypothetical protein
MVPTNICVADVTLVIAIVVAVVAAVVEDV